MAKTEILSPAVRVKINNEWVELPALKGEKGDAASTIRVGEVRSGSTASVVNSGTVNDVVLDFVLPKGDRGLQGIQGERGLQGEPGPKGDKGDKGDRGERGMQGLQGLQGLQGERGLQGEKGEKGDKGERGLQGIKGDPLTWADLTEEQKASLKGEQGAPGPQGERGEQGIQGEPGPRGEQGIQGRDADSYTFEVKRLYWQEAVNYIALEGYLVVNGEKKSDYEVNAYCRNNIEGDWQYTNAFSWDTSNNELLVMFSGYNLNNDLKEIRLDFLKDGSVLYSHYIQIPQNGADGQNGKDGYTPVKGVDYFDGKDGQRGADGYTPVKGVDYFDGKDADTYTFEVDDLYWDEAVKYTFIKGYLVVNGERKSDYNVEGYCRNNIGSSWKRETGQSWDASNNELTVMFSSPSNKDDIKEIRLDFLKDGSVLYSYYMQIVRDGKTGESATVQVGTVTDGDTVSVVNVGDEHNAILNFTLKKGKDYEIEVRDAVSLMEGGLSYDEALAKIGVESLGAGNVVGWAFDFDQRYRLPTIPVGDVVYFAFPYTGANVAFLPPSEGKYLFDDKIHPMPVTDRYGYWYDKNGVKIITNPDWDDGDIEQVKLQRYE